MICLERRVNQYKPSEYSRRAEYLSFETISYLMEKSGIGWNDVKYVYEFVSREIQGKKQIERVSIYLQCGDGSYDYRYIDGLDFLASVKSVASEIVKFFKGD